MKIQQFLQHHGLAANPFADEDAQTDLVFKTGCLTAVRHPAWDKIYGDPREPSTAVVFGEKGAGKTAIRLQIARQLTDHNAENPQSQVLLVPYDDFNPFLDRFREQMGWLNRRIDRTLAQWRLWDHIDAILSLAVTQLVDRALRVTQARHPAARDEPLPLDRLSASEKRDFLLLAACYDQSTAENRDDRFHRLRSALGLKLWESYWDWAVGAGVSAAVAAAVALGGWWSSLATPWPYAAAAAGWLPRAWNFARGTYQAWQIAGNTRCLKQPIGMLRRMLNRLGWRNIVGRPLPTQARTDDRYELLAKLQGVLRAMDIAGIVVVVDRVDEPYLINGATDLMRAFVWPLLDNKLLKHQGLGLKILLPIELERLIDREDQEFRQRARLDKQNMLRGLPWTGQALYDLAAARLKACAASGAEPRLLDWFEPPVDQRRLISAFEQLRVPRNLFKFMFRVLTAHCNAHTEEQPQWRIPSGLFESVFALYQRDQDAFDRGVGAG